MIRGEYIWFLSRENDMLRWSDLELSVGFGWLRARWSENLRFQQVLGSNEKKN